MHKTSREAFGSICPSNVEAVNPQIAANEPNKLAKNTHDIPEKRSNRGSPEAAFCLTNLQVTTCPFTATTQRVFDKRSHPPSSQQPLSTQVHRLGDPLMLNVLLSSRSHLARIEQCTVCSHHTLHCSKYQRSSRYPLPCPSPDQDHENLSYTISSDFHYSLECKMFVNSLVSMFVGAFPYDSYLSTQLLPIDVKRAFKHHLCEFVVPVENFQVSLTSRSGAYNI